MGSFFENTPLPGVEPSLTVVLIGEKCQTARDNTIRARMCGKDSVYDFVFQLGGASFSLTAPPLT